MYIFLTILLWLLLIFLGLLVLVLFLPVGVSVELKYDKLKVCVKILFLSFQIYPQKQKEDRKSKHHENSGAKSETMREAKDKSVLTETTENELHEDTTKAKQEPDKKFETNEKNKKINVGKILEIIKSSGRPIKILFKGIFFTKIQIIFPVHEDDSAETAIEYGKTQAFFGGIVATLQNFFNLSFKSVNIIPDFNNEHKYKRYFYCNIWSTTFIMVVAAVNLFIALRREKII